MILKRKVKNAVQPARADHFESQEITRDSAQDLKKRLIDKEKVHPFVGADAIAELDANRLSPPSQDHVIWDKHCYGLFEAGKLTPKIVVYVKLLHMTPDADGNIPSGKLPGDIHAVLSEPGKPVDAPNAAIFYTISDMGREAALVANPAEPKKNSGRIPSLKLSAGQRLVREVAGQLAQDYGIAAFSTLSPLRSGKYAAAKGFAQWLEGHTNLTANEFTRVNTIAGGSGDTTPYVSLQRCIAKRANLNASDRDFLGNLMNDLAIYYVVHEKQQVNTVSAPAKQTLSLRDRLTRLRTKKPAASFATPLDGVTMFHIANGAELANIHWLWPEQSTASDVEGAFGMMVNYRYYPELLDARKGNFHERSIVRLSPQLAERYYARLEALGEKAPTLNTHAASGCDLLPPATERPATELVLPIPTIQLSPPVINDRLLPAANQEMYAQANGVVRMH